MMMYIETAGRRASTAYPQITEKHEHTADFLQTFRRKLQLRFARLYASHPMAAFLILLVCVPALIVLTVLVLTTVLMLPMGLLMGWL